MPLASGLGAIGWIRTSLRAAHTARNENCVVALMIGREGWNGDRRWVKSDGEDGFLVLCS